MSEGTQGDTEFIHVGCQAKTGQHLVPVLDLGYSKCVLYCAGKIIHPILYLVLLSMYNCHLSFREARGVFNM